MLLFAYLPMPKWKLFKRTCKCGCKKTWRALKSSKTEYASIFHDPGLDGQRRKDLEMRLIMVTKKIQREELTLILSKDEI